jgi:glycosyltransferase involved in cell wall biosynthesis
MVGSGPDNMLLSICVPTYNRPNCIAAILENYEQVIVSSNLQDEVEVCITDNGFDNDATEKLVSDFLKTARAKIRYVRHKSNIGYDNNVLAALGLGTGQYLHLVADKDLYSKESLINIVSRLKAQTPDSACIVSYNLPFMPSLGSLPDTLDGPDLLYEQAFSPRGNKLGFFVGLCWYLIKRSDFERFREETLPNPKLYYAMIMHTPLALYAFCKSKKILIFKNDFRGIPPTVPLETTTFSYPSDTAKIYYDYYYKTVKSCAECGFLQGRHFEQFKGGFYRFIMADLFKLRTRMYPELFSSERSKILPHLRPFEEDLIGAKRAFYFFWKYLVLHPSMPFHLVYRAFIFYKVKIRKQKRDDYHEFYSKRLADKGKFVSISELEVKPKK